MKKLFNLVSRATLLAGALWLGSCQQEFEEVNTSDMRGSSFTGDSETALLFLRTTSNDGSFDNIVDGASCISINFPYSLTVNGQDITVLSREDIEYIEEIFDESITDEDFLEIKFPITLTLSDQTVVTVASPEVLAELANDCVEGGGDDDIECTDFVYPISFITFDRRNTQTGQVIMENDQQLYRFIKDRGMDDFISVQYPVTFVDLGGNETQVEDNQQLAEHLILYENLCDEDDDNDFDDDDFILEGYSLLFGCAWEIVSMEGSGEGPDSDFTGYIFNFYQGNGWDVDPYVRVTGRDGISRYGSYFLDDFDTGLTLQLQFEGSLSDFNQQWKLNRVSAEKIRLYDNTGNGVVIKKTTCYGQETPILMDLDELLPQCKWIIGKHENPGENINSLLGYELEFLSEGVVKLTGGEVVSQGIWEADMDPLEGSKLTITLNEVTGISYDWPLMTFLNGRMGFADADGEFELSLVQLCDNVDDDGVQRIENYLSQGSWHITSTGSYGWEDAVPDGLINREFSFSPGGQLVVSYQGQTVKTGLWRVTRGQYADYNIILNLGVDDVAFSILTLDWGLGAISTNWFRLESGPGVYYSEFYVVFEK